MNRNRALIPSVLDELESLRKLFSDVDADFLSFPKEEFSGVSIYENNDKIFAEAALPGIKPKDIQLNFEKGILWIKGEQKEEEKDVKYLLKSSRTFSYRIPIPSRIDEKTAPEATYKDGILKISFSKSQAAKPQKIEIKTEE